MKKEQLEALKVGQWVYCKWTTSRTKVYWLIVRVYLDCVYIEGDIEKQDGSVYKSRRIVAIKCLERDWDIYE